MKFKWEEIADGAAAEYADLPTGCYVLKVLDAAEERDYQRFGDTYDRVVIHWDVAEGEYADFFTTNDKPDFTHEHEFRLTDDIDSIEGNRRFLYTQLYDRFLPAVKASNDVHGVGDVAQLKGLLFGATVRHRLYTKRDGSDGNVLEIQQFYPAEKMRTMDIPPNAMPKDRDRRATATAPKPTGKAYEDAEIPF